MDKPILRYPTQTGTSGTSDIVVNVEWCRRLRRRPTAPLGSTHGATPTYRNEEGNR
ncbi:MAG TPA: hypothetical protein VHW47_06565 [Acidimicrobiales bacterium]|jgi:hypothetical protein|nr:hypothetical protein [Acidimicrobiales bacterium]